MNTIKLFVANQKKLDDLKDGIGQEEVLKDQCLKLNNSFPNEIINLFVVCPKNSENLKDQKELIKEQCLNINEEFAKDKKNIKIIPVTYDDSERREEVCKKIIKYRADIVVFLFDNKYDEGLLDELQTAVNRSKGFHRPEPLVFVKADKTPTGEIKVNQKLVDKIKMILAEGGWLYEYYSDIEDLWPKLLYKIERYVNSYPSIREIRKWEKRKYIGFYYLLPFFVVLAIVLFYFLRKAESRRLLIIGGGSARQYVEGPAILNKHDGLKTLFWINAPMPSGDSYRIIAEESIKNYGRYQDRPYYPIVLSAQKALEKEFLRTSNRDEFKKTGIVVGIKLGDDYLVIYGKDSAFTEEMRVADTAIRITTIDEFIKKQIDSFPSESDSTTKSKPIAIYSTSENSGTLNSYFKICDSLRLREYLKKCEASQEGRRSFSNIDSLPKEKDSIWIALGSKYYSPNNNAMKSFTVLDNRDSIQVKPIYVYFMLYKKENSETYILPKATEHFLKQIIKNDKKLISNLRKVSKDDTSIIDLNNSNTILYDSFIRTTFIRTN